MNSDSIVIESRESFMDKVRKRASRLLPCTQWIAEMTPTSVAFDTLAGLTSGLILIPQSLSYATMMHVPLQHGLYTAMFCGIPYCLFGTSRDIAVGPSAVLSLVIATTVVHMNPTDGQEWICGITVLAGMMQLLMGLLNLGAMVSLLSHSVITGFCSGAALVVAFTQLPTWFRIEKATDFVSAMKTFYNNIHKTHKYDLIIGMSVFVFLIAGQFALKYVKDSRLKVLLACRNVFAILGSMLVGYALYKPDGKTPFAIVGNVPSGLPSFTLPKFDFHNYQQLFADAFIIAMAGFVEEVALCFKYAGIRVKRIVVCEQNPENNDTAPMPPRRVSANQELVAFGFANMISGMFRGFGVTASMARTAVQHACNVHTPFANIWSFVLTLTAVLFATEPLKYIPSAALASVIIAGVITVVDLQSIIEDIKLGPQGYADASINAITMLSCLGLGVKKGLVMGIAVHLAWMVYKQTDAMVSTSQKPILSQYSQSSKPKSIGVCINIDVIGSIHYICASRLSAKVRKVKEHYQQNPCPFCYSEENASESFLPSEDVRADFSINMLQPAESVSMSIPSTMDTHVTEEQLDVSVNFLTHPNHLDTHQLQLKTTKLHHRAYANKLYSPYVAIIFDLSKTFQIDATGMKAISDMCEAMVLDGPSCHPVAVSIHFITSPPITPWFQEKYVTDKLNCGNTILSKQMHIHQSSIEAMEVINLEADITIRLLETNDFDYVFQKTPVSESQKESQKQPLIEQSSVNKQATEEYQSFAQVNQALATYLYKSELYLDSLDEATAWIEQNKI